MLDRIDALLFAARRLEGERVAVKVRRPNIGPLIAADRRALDWLLIAAETLTILTPGTTRGIRQDLQSIQFKELNFRTEARYTDLFRRRAIKRGGDRDPGPDGRRRPARPGARPPRADAEPEDGHGDP